MDLRHYFRKMREIEASIRDEHPFVTSLETSDGGKAGVVTEVSRELAAKMIAEGRATLSTEAEKERFLEQQSAERATAQKAEMARRLQVTVVTDSDAGRFSQHTDSGSLTFKK